MTAFTLNPFTIDTDFALVRYDSAGVPDQTFGTGGTVLTEFAGGIDQAYALARQADGKIVAAGYASRTSASGGDTEFALARYLADGFARPHVRERREGDNRPDALHRLDLRPGD